MRVSLTPLVAAVLYLVALLPLLVADNDGRPHPREYLLDRLAIVAALCVTFSLTVETLQFVLPSRYSSLVDVLTNTTGVVLGAVLAA